MNKLNSIITPELNSSGNVVFEANPDRKPYIIFDARRDSPVGFGVKVSLTKNTYVIQRRVASSDRNVSEGKKPSSVLKGKAGNASELPDIDEVGKVARR
ncbi:hypothetical protein FNI11_14960 [Salmonella enterica subsp. salamae]|nr:hypothetical protein [Salmonella enterica subsp. salamae]ECJ2281815.1 hypothetical protein [Salmonella enterica subsp. salamae]